MHDTIKSVLGRRVWDSRGRPTVEVEVRLESGATGRSIAPAGASRGQNEAVDLRDGGLAFGGFDVTSAVDAVNGPIASALTGMTASNQVQLDLRLIEIDGTPNKARLGGNALIATSMACAWAAADALRIPLWKYLAGDATDLRLPLPEIQIFGGGAHAASRVDVQDFMIIATGAKTYAQALEMTAEVYRSAGAVMSDAGLLAGVADEGGYWPMFDSNEMALDMLMASIERAGFRPGEDISISLDIAASEFHVDDAYRLALDNSELSTDEMIDLLVGWINRYPIVSIEDPLGETDEAGLIAFTNRVGDRVQVIGDDYLVTAARRVERAVALSACNAVLVKPNQAGTLTETKAALSAAHNAGWDAVVSARSGETEDTTIVHLSVGWGARHLKVGSFARSERMAKWNEGLRIADQLGQAGGILHDQSEFRWNKP